ncbi:hypothetical protein KY358_03850 [Candidatus Woesearchaeota archaeon]|nr:hypothetical protein [Candidatus Woesearchaeota archaeon]
MKIMKGARIRIFSLIIAALAIILLIFLIKNGWDIQAASKDMLSLVGLAG